MIDKDTSKELGKYFVDISKLVLGGVVLATVLKIENFPKIVVIVTGILASLIFSILGFIIIKISNKKQ